MYNPASALMGKSAVFEAMAEEPAVVALAELATDAKFDRNELTITVARREHRRRLRGRQGRGIQLL